MSAANSCQPKPKRKRYPPRKPGDPLRPMGRPRKDGLPPIQSEGQAGGGAAAKAPPAAAAARKPASGCESPNSCDQGAPPAPPKTKKALRERVARLAGIGLLLIDIAAAVDAPIEDLQEGGRLNRDVRRGIAWANEQVAQAAFDKATASSGNPIPMIFFAKCRLGWRETGERETDVKKVRQIKRVTFRVIEGGLRGGPEGGSDSSRGGAGDADSALHGAVAGVNSAVPGHSRG